MDPIAEEARATILRLGAVSTFYAQEDETISIRAAEALHALFCMKRIRFVRDIGSRAALMHYASDATGRKTTHHVVSAEKGLVARAGTRLSEFLVERVFFKGTTLLGEDVGEVFVMEPRCLDHGKGAWHTVGALLDVPTLKELGHSGISVSHYAFDRAIYPSLSQKVHRRHAKRWEELKAADGDKYDPLP